MLELGLVLILVGMWILINMATEALTRYSELTAVDTDVTVKALLGTTVENFVVPEGKAHLRRAILQYSMDGAAVGSSGAVLKLNGTGLSRSPQQLPMGTFGAELNTTHATFSPEVDLDNLNIQAVGGGNTITAVIMMVGEDTGSGVATATLIFSSDAIRGALMQYECLEVQATAVDTKIALQGLGTGASVKFSVPGDLANLSGTIGRGALRRIIHSAQGDAAGTGGSGMTLFLSENGMVDNQTYTMAGFGGTNATEANGHGSVSDLDNLDVDLKKTNPILAEVSINGEDTGTVTALVCLGIQYRA